MSREYDHVLLTRFSVRFGRHEPPGDNWLLYRWMFFRDALVSSISRGSARPHEWLVFFDESAPEWLRAEIDALAPGLFTPVYLAEPWGVVPVRRAVESVTSAPFLITTRVDSDDAVAVRFIEDIQAQFARQASLYVCFLSGVQIERGGQLFHYDEPSGPFLTYIEQRRPHTSPRTVFQSLGHGDSRDYGPLLTIVGPPRWMQVIHGGNLANGIRGLRIAPTVVEAEFDLDLEYTHDVPAPRLHRERAVSVLRLALRWARQPYLIGEFFATRRLRAAGTSLQPRRPA